MKKNGSQIGVYVLFTLMIGGCSQQTSQPAPLPPLDMSRASLAAGEPGQYRLQPGDVLRVKFLYHPELDIKLPIRPDGDVTLQMTGPIHAAGMTTSELENAIKERTSDRLRNPEISVIVAQLGEQKVYVGGQVRIPGFVAYHPGMNALQAIMDRGGFTDTARMDSVLRLSPSQNTYQGTRLDFSKPLSEGMTEQVQLIAGDVIYVPRTFIGDMDTFVRLYIREILPISPKVGAGTVF
jgi:protein involved in polysaccharide export with SLBB domain